MDPIIDPLFQNLPQIRPIPIRQIPIQPPPNVNSVAIGMGTFTTLPNEIMIGNLSCKLNITETNVNITTPTCSFSVVEFLSNFNLLSEENKRLKESINELTDRISKLEEVTQQLLYIPGAPGYEEARFEFNSLMKEL